MKKNNEKVSLKYYGLLIFVVLPMFVFLILFAQELVNNLSEEQFEHEYSEEFSDKYNVSFLGIKLEDNRFIYDNNSIIINDNSDLVLISSYIYENEEYHESILSLMSEKNSVILLGNPVLDYAILDEVKLLEKYYITSNHSIDLYGHGWIYKDDSNSFSPYLLMSNFQDNDEIHEYVYKNLIEFISANES